MIASCSSLQKTLYLSSLMYRFYPIWTSNVIDSALYKPIEISLLLYSLKHLSKKESYMLLKQKTLYTLMLYTLYTLHSTYWLLLTYTYLYLFILTLLWLLWSLMISNDWLMLLYRSNVLCIDKLINMSVLRWAFFNRFSYIIYRHLLIRGVFCIGKRYVLI